ncbi:hypothetical protein Bp8pS_230 [Bacillus phage vB_BpuM-BpSp]|nr:hypothetical protein Bp8pS_230 [Bacillus phage vB_BpuM-BpSp]
MSGVEVTIYNNIVDIYFLDLHYLIENKLFFEYATEDEKNKYTDLIRELNMIGNFEGIAEEIRRFIIGKDGVLECLFEFYPTFDDYNLLFEITFESFEKIPNPMRKLDTERLLKEL